MSASNPAILADHSPSARSATPGDPPSDLFSRVRFVLVSPSHPGNVGAAARAIKTMGFAELVLVTPRLSDVQADPEA